MASRLTELSAAYNAERGDPAVHGSTVLPLASGWRT